MKIGQQCLCAVHDKNLFQLSFSEALAIGALDSSLSEKYQNILTMVKNFRKIDNHTEFP